jgi:hypothetical protein
LRPAANPAWFEWPAPFDSAGVQPAR